MSDDDLPIAIADSPESAEVGAQMVRDGRAAALIVLADRPGGGIDVRYYVRRGHEHRFSEVEELIAASAERMGTIAVDPARLVGRGAA